jgi:hypothetical protein
MTVHDIAVARHVGYDLALTQYGDDPWAGDVLSDRHSAFDPRRLGLAADTLAGCPARGVGCDPARREPVTTRRAARASPVSSAPVDALLPDW